MEKIDLKADCFLQNICPNATAVRDNLYKFCEPCHCYFNEEDIAHLALEKNYDEA
jgi:hypothetical protein